MASKVAIDNAAFGKLSAQAIKDIGLPAMHRVAAAANSADGLTDGYRASDEGPGALRKSSFRATVITATAEAMAKNAKNNTLVNNFHLAADNA